MRNRNNNIQINPGNGQNRQYSLGGGCLFLFVPGIFNYGNKKSKNQS